MLINIKSHQALWYVSQLLPPWFPFFYCLYQLIIPTQVMLGLRFSTTVPRSTSVPSDNVRCAVKNDPISLNCSKKNNNFPLLIDCFKRDVSRFSSLNSAPSALSASKQAKVSHWASINNSDTYQKKVFKKVYWTWWCCCSEGVGVVICLLDGRFLVPCRSTWRFCRWIWCFLGISGSQEVVPRFPDWLDNFWNGLKTKVKQATSDWWKYTCSKGRSFRRHTADQAQGNINLNLRLTGTLKENISKNWPSSQQESDLQAVGETPQSRDQTPEILPSLNSVQGWAAGSQTYPKPLRTRGLSLSSGFKQITWIYRYISWLKQQQRRHDATSIRVARGALLLQVDRSGPVGWWNIAAGWGFCKGTFVKASDDAAWCLATFPD